MTGATPIGAHRDIAHPWLVLASRSPRRLALLRDAGLDPSAIDPGVDDSEVRLAPVAPSLAAVALAYLKAAAGAELPEAHERVVLAADTFVLKAGRIIGKPADESDADRIIRLLSNGVHEVLTAVCLLDRREGGPGRSRRFLVDRARVRVGEIRDDERRAYLATGAWRGKAGAYNLAGRLSDGWPIACAGDPTTVMGLPMRRLSPILSALGAGAPATPEPTTP